MRAWRFSSGGDGRRQAAERAERRAVRLEHGADGDLGERDAQTRGELARVPQASLGGVRPGHRDAEDLVRPERLDREGRRDRGVDAARQAENGRLEPALARVVGEREDEGPPQSLHRGKLRRGRPAAARHVDRPEILFEPARRADQSAARVEGGRRAVEDEVVVAADEVAVHERHARAAGDALHHAPPQAVLPEGPGRGGDVDVEVEPERAQLRHRIGVVERPLPEGLVVPDVLADGDRDAAAGDAQHERAPSRLDVAALVEDVVRRQQTLAIERHAPSPPGGDCGVGDAASGRPRVRDERSEDPGRVARRPRDLRGGALARRDELVSLDEVARRVAADGELRKEDEVGAGGLGAASVLDDLRRVAREVADRDVDLRDGDLQRRAPGRRAPCGEPPSQARAGARRGGRPASAVRGPGASTKGRGPRSPPSRSFRSTAARPPTRACRRRRPTAPRGRKWPSRSCVRTARGAAPWRRTRGTPRSRAPRAPRRGGARSPSGPGRRGARARRAGARRRRRRPRPSGADRARRLRPAAAPSTGRRGLRLAERFEAGLRAEGEILEGFGGAGRGHASVFYGRCCTWRT